MMRFSSFTYLVGQGLHNMRANRLMTFASMGVQIVCMILVGAALLFGMNIDAMVDYIGEQNESYVYLVDGLSDEQITAAGDAIKAVPGVVSVTYISPTDVLTEFDGMLQNYTNLMDTFSEDNPFHSMYKVVVDDVSNIDSIIEQLRVIENVESVSATRELSKLFVSIQRVVNYVSYGLVAVLALVSIVVINNTIRLTVFARRKEIGIMKLVGATNGFIRFPFFVEGVTSGLISAIVSSGVVCGAYYALYRWYLENPSNLSNLLGGTLVPLESVWYYIVIGFVAFGFVMCGIGTATSIRKHLNV